MSFAHRGLGTAVSWKLCGRFSSGIDSRPAYVGETCSSLPRDSEFVRPKLWERSSLHWDTLYISRTANVSEAREMNARRGFGCIKIRMKGGGPRTYPGDLKKWQWKRQQRKDARVLEKARRSRERNLFVKRRRLQELSELSMGSGQVGGLSLESDECLRSKVVWRDSVGSPSQVLSPANPCGEYGPDGALGGSEGHPRGEEGRWVCSRSEVEEQIRKVRARLSEQYWRPTGSAEDDARSFSQLSLSPLTVKALNYALNIQQMTRVQEATLPTILKGYDLLAQTRLHGEDAVTSLIFAIELVLNRACGQQPLSRLARIQLKTVSGRHPVTALLICPTQDSASFVASVFKRLSLLHRSIQIQVVKSGNDVIKEKQRLQNSPCEILIATPGRLLHHLQQSKEFCGQLVDLKLLAILEMQRLLDMGYEKTVEQISHKLPRSRQTLLWSHSHSDQILGLSSSLLKEDHKVVKCGERHSGEVACQMAKQHFIIVSVESHLAQICRLLKNHAANVPQFKAIVFCQTVRASTLASEVFKCIGFHTREVHARKNEKQNELVLAEFQAAKGNVILFTSGAMVSRATFPDVTLVLQIGSPVGKQQYHERVTLSGLERRTADYLLLLMPHQMSFLDVLPYSLEEADSLEEDEETQIEVQVAVRQVNHQVRAKAYVAWLRYHMARRLPDDHPSEVLRIANKYSSALGFSEPPHLNAKIKRVLGLDFHK